MKKKKITAGPGAPITWILIAVTLIGLTAAVYLLIKKPKPRETIPRVSMQEKTPDQPANTPQPPPPVINYNRLHEDNILSDLMEDRKKKFGMNKSVDMIVRSDETLTIGDTTIPMSEILEKIKISNRDFVEQNIRDQNSSPGFSSQFTKELEIKQIEEEIKQRKSRFHALHEILKQESPALPSDEMQKKEQEYIKLGYLINQYKDLIETEQIIENTEKRLDLPIDRIKEEIKNDILKLKQKQQMPVPDQNQNQNQNQNQALNRQSSKEETEKAFQALSEKINAPEVVKQRKSRTLLLNEHEKLEQIVTDYESLRGIIKDIAARKALLPGIVAHPRDEAHMAIAQLETQKAQLEEKLRRNLLALYPAKSFPNDDPDTLLRHLEDAENRFLTLDDHINAPDFRQKEEADRQDIREHAVLGRKLRKFKQYNKIEQQIRQQEALLQDDTDIKEALRLFLNRLRIEKGTLEADLKRGLISDDPKDLYGIHIVRRGDNIWNIHFDFLKSYFASRGVNIRSTADEPIAPGKSSGFGKVLKFSEKMVYIFNLRERVIEPDLDLIHPLSKIVVFNLSRVFSMLSSIDVTRIRQIRFDGENLWVPAE